MELKNNEPCQSCGRYMNRAMTVDAVIVRDGKILLIKRGSEPYKGFWAVPGGYVDFDETTEEAVRREVKEETGLIVTSLEFIGLYSDPKRHPKQCVSAAYVVEAKGEVKVGDDALEFKWESIKNFGELAFDHKKIIDDYLKKK
jgi:8-oxo-dGTP diphosphatase